MSVKDLSAAYGRHEALHGISFDAAKKETLAIMDRNGMGKTPLFKRLMGVLPTRSGAVTVTDQDIHHGKSDRRVAKGMA